MFGCADPSLPGGLRGPQLPASHGRSLSAIAGIVAENSAAALLFDDEKLAQEILGGLHVEPEVTQAALFSNQGKLFATYPANLPASEFPQSPENPAIQLGGARSHVVAIGDAGKGPRGDDLFQRRFAGNLSTIGCIRHRIGWD